MYYEIVLDIYITIEKLIWYQDRNLEFSTWGSVHLVFYPSFQVIKLIDYGFNFCLFSVVSIQKMLIEHRSIQVLKPKAFLSRVIVNTSTYYYALFFFHRISHNLTITSKTRTRRRTHHSLHWEQSSSVSIIVTNVAAVLFDVTVASITCNERWKMEDLPQDGDFDCEGKGLFKTFIKNLERHSFGGISNDKKDFF